MRLNGWQRIGIILSVVWILGASLYQRTSDTKRASDFADLTYQTCATAEQRKSDPDLVKCAEESGNNWRIFLTGSWGNVAAAALVPVPLGWLFVYAVVALWRWVRRGFGSKLSAPE